MLGWSDPVPTPTLSFPLPHCERAPLNTRSYLLMLGHGLLLGLRGLPILPLNPSFLGFVSFILYPLPSPPPLLPSPSFPLASPPIYPFCCPSPGTMHSSSLWSGPGPLSLTATVSLLIALTFIGSDHGPGVLAVKEHDFKKCEKSSFCRRHRALADHYDSTLDHVSPYRLVPESVTLSPEGLLEGILTDARNGTILGPESPSYIGPFTPLSLSVHLLKDGLVRVRVNEIDPIRPRYQEFTKNILISEPLLVGTAGEPRLTQHDDGSSLQVHWKSQPDSSTMEKEDEEDARPLSLHIQTSPFSLTLLQGKESIIELNSDGLFHMERYRLKDQPIIRSSLEAPSEEKEGPAAEADTNADDSKVDANTKDEGNSEGGEEVKSQEGQEKEQEQPKSKEVWREDETGMWDEFFGGHTDTKPHGPSSFGMDISFPAAAQVYGIPEHSGPLALRTTRGIEGEEGTFTDPYRLYNLDVFEYNEDSPMALYGSIPLLFAHRSPGRTAGVFWFNPSETWVDITRPSATSESPNPGMRTHWMSETGVLDLFLFPGPSPQDILARYTDLTGKPALPPAFSLAYHQCRWNYLDIPDVLNVDKQFDAHSIPYDVIWLDIEHTDDKKYFTWDPSKFPNPSFMLDTLASKGRHLVSIIDPHIKRADGYFVYEQAKAQDLMVKSSDGVTEFEGWCWPGKRGRGGKGEVRVVQGLQLITSQPPHPTSHFV